ncbi:hypothetical protein [Singulisphaera sp. GP187]|uniref:hypothetical protein n=1 Tax=Singulisphaera sp. GP187 TaxID=1882752 RepID=UPI0009414DBB|nr:hypothetical protein [Singulisphaera sp. GP187]
METRQRTMVADYYTMLGVDPGADRGALEAALARCQPLWSSGTRNPKNKHTYQSYLDQIPAIRQALLGAPADRAAYDAELAAAQRVERDRKLDALQRRLRLRSAKGGLTVADRALLRDEAVRLGLTAADLDRLAELIPPKPESPAEEDAPDPPVDVLDPAMRRQIRVALTHLRRLDLYEALSLTRDAPAQEIINLTDAERRRWMQKAQVTAEKTAWLELVSHAQSHLTTPESRARYDRTLALEAEEALIASIEFALQGLPRLDPGTRNALHDEGAALGITPDRVDRLIVRACRSLGVARDAGPSAATAPVAPRLLRCRACAGVTDFAQAARQKAAACRHCRASLHWDCPICKKPHWVDEPRCPCGFRVELRDPLIRHFEAATRAYKTRDLETALRHLQRIQEFAPKHVGTRKAMERIQHRLADINRARAAWESARTAGRLVAALEALELWASMLHPSHPEVDPSRADVTTPLRRAQSLAARGRAAAATDPRAARSFYQQSLALASDLPEALDGLHRCPPDHPSSLIADYVDGRVRLRWVAPAPDGLGPLSYVLLRKHGGAIEHLADGTRIAEVTATEYDDGQVNPGDTVSYAALSKRGGAESISAAAIGPIVLLGEVTDVRVEASDHEVDLFWSPPANALDIRVVRKLGAPPTGVKDGERVETLRDRAHDRHLENDRVYHYGLFSVYKRPDGPMVASRGVFVSAQPHPPIEVLPTPTLALDAGGRIRLDWPRPPRGTVKILRTLKPAGRAPGDRLSIAEAEALDGHWLDVTAPDHASDPSPPALGVCHYTPMIASAGMLTVGRSVAYSCVPDPSDLRATRVGHGQRVHLRWRWSPQGAQSLIVARAGAAPLDSDDPEAHRILVHELDYGRLGHHTLTLPLNVEGPWHIRVYSVAQVAGQTVVSPGLEPTARTLLPGPHPEVTVSYAFRRPGFPGRPWQLTFRTEPAGAEIPPTALVAHPRTIPLSVDDGEIVQQFPASRDGSTFPIRSKLNLANQRARIFADPHTEPDNMPPIRLRHPENGVTRA